MYTTFSVWTTFVLQLQTKLSAACDWLNCLSLDLIDQSQAADNLVTAAVRTSLKHCDIVSINVKIEDP